MPQVTFTVTDVPEDLRVKQCTAIMRILDSLLVILSGVIPSDQSKLTGRVVRFSFFFF